ncbi:NAD(P)/FAD-dependent oxidoreductase [Candidatus Woesearchaeota archaeon]|nr:NAD(P)/FAD-dependent oxidoreductase [Candidatus Woesearchaeota archaeon]
MRILIIGAGPSGSYAASILAKHHDVSVLEEHSTIGTPVQCTGIITDDIFRFIPKNHKSICNKVKDVRIISPLGSVLDIRLQKPDVIIDRTEFDRHFYNEAKEAGAMFYLKKKFINHKGNKASVKNLASGKKLQLEFDCLIGADGPQSAVAKSASMFGHRKFFIGVQAVIRKRNDNCIEFFPRKNGFGWSVPVDDDHLRVGFASTNRTRDEFQALLKRYEGKVLETQGGLIPLYDPTQQFQSGSIFLVGDAATFVKATTGGGIIPGLESAELASKAIDERKDYASLLKRKVCPSLSLNLKMRKIMNTFSDEEWDKLIIELDNEHSRKVFSKVNRDRIFPLVAKTAIANPKLMKYAFKRFNLLF